jgi:hypothetical protein
VQQAEAMGRTANVLLPSFPTLSRMMLLQEQKARW